MQARPVQALWRPLVLQSDTVNRIYRFGGKVVKYSAGRWGWYWLASLLPSWISGTSCFYCLQTDISGKLCHGVAFWNDCPLHICTLGTVLRYKNICCTGSLLCPFLLGEHGDADGRPLCRPREARWGGGKGFPSGNWHSLRVRLRVLHRRLDLQLRILLHIWTPLGWSLQSCSGKFILILIMQWEKFFTTEIL